MWQKKTQSAPFLQFGLNSKYDKTQIITKHKLWQTHIVTTQIVLKTQIVTKLSIRQNSIINPQIVKKKNNNKKKLKV